LRAIALGLLLLGACKRSGPGEISADPAKSIVPSASAGPAPSYPPFSWATNEAEARALASREHRPMILDFTADWSMPCVEMRTKIYMSARFHASARRFVGLRIDATTEDDPSFVANAKTYDVKGLPTVVILDSKGDVAKIFPTVVDADTLAAALDEVR
jgi:thiol:disulfide interchange protein DsbD